MLISDLCRRRKECLTTNNTSLDYYHLYPYYWQEGQTSFHQPGLISKIPDLAGYAARLLYIGWGAKQRVVPSRAQTLSL